MTMADARALLRNQRETRKINHPYASYSSSGKLLCSICNVVVKTESLWASHLKTSEHIIRTQKLQAAPSEPPSKKRKADSDSDDGRKRTKGLDTEEDDGDGDFPQTSEAGNDAEPTEVEATEDSGTNGVKTWPQPNIVPQVDEDEEWLALQQAIDAAPTINKPTIPSTATISAPAVSAGELAAQAREEQSTQRGRRDEEIDAEKEDAARALEDEFQEMEELEDRVRRLREKREAIRVGGVAEIRKEPESVIAAAVAQNVSSTDAADAVSQVDGAKNNEDEDEDEDDEEEDLDVWKFGAR